MWYQLVKIKQVVQTVIIQSHKFVDTAPNIERVIVSTV